MPTSLIRTPRDERLWEKAKGIAEEAGHKENWAYVMGVYKNMNPDRFDKAAGGYEVYTVTLEAPEGADEFDQVETTLHTYNLVDRTPFDDGIDYLVEVPSRYVSDFLQDMELLARNVRPHKFEVREGEHGPKLRLASKGPSASRVALRHRQAYDEKGRTPEEGWQHGQVEPFQRTDGEGSQTPPSRDNQGKPLAVPDLGTLEIPGYEWHDKSKSFHQVVTKTAYLRSPSSPLDAEPLGTREMHAAWDAGYEAVTRVAGDRSVVDADDVWIWVAKRDRRIPRGMVEGHPQFWEWHWAVIEGAYAGAKDYNILMTGVPAQIRTADESHEFLGIDVRSCAERRASWWTDLAKLVKEYWSLQPVKVTLGRGKLEFDVFHVRQIHVEVRGTPEAPTVYVGGTEKKFTANDSLQDILMWIDGVPRGRGVFAAKEKSINIDARVTAFTKAAREFIDDKADDLKKDVESVLQSRGFAPKSVVISNLRGEINVIGRFTDTADTYRTREEVDNIFYQGFGTYGQLSGYSPNWEFRMGAWPGY